MATKLKTKKTTAKKTKGSGKAAAKLNKTAKVIALMQRASGVSRPQILEATGWKAVSPQALAAKAGLKIKLEKLAGKPTVYRAG